MTHYVAQGLRELPEQRHLAVRSPLPVAVPPTGVPIAAISRAELARIDEEEELARDARSSRR